MKKVVAFILIFTLMLALVVPSYGDSAEDLYEDAVEDEILYSSTIDANFDLNVNSAYLIEASTGKVLYAKNELSGASPASVTKIMTLLLVCEALDSGKFTLQDTVSISAYAASMGGSQVFLEEGEKMTVEDLIKSTVIASANDAAVALAELVSGSENAFVNKMNERAAELGLKNTSFENTTGLDDTTTNHYSCAADIAAMSRELIKHDIILKYSSIWQDTIRDGEFTLTNTNRLVRYYDGCNGLKTGSTDKAGYCVSTTAKRGNMQLIAVIMGANTRDERNAAARTLLDFGFSNYALYEVEEQFVENVPVLKGMSNYVPVYLAPFSAVIDKGELSSVEMVYKIPESIVAPIAKDSVVGRVIYMLGEEEIGSSDILTDDEVGKIGVLELFKRILYSVIAGGKN